MAAPKRKEYVAKSGPLAGIVFEGKEGTSQAYNKYQQALAKEYGFTSYSRQRRITRSYAFQQSVTNPETGRRVVGESRERLLRAYAPIANLRKDQRDDLSPDGPLAKALVALGRRSVHDRHNVGDS